MSPDQQVYEFDGFRVDALRRVLQRDGATIALTPKVFDTLLYLVRNAGDVIDKEELMRAVWPDTAVEENNLSQNISVLRRGTWPGAYPRRSRRAAGLRRSIRRLNYIFRLEGPSRRRWR